MKIESSYIITIKGHKLSENLAKRCYDSCMSVNMPVVYWEAFDGTESSILKFPSHIKEHNFYCSLNNSLGYTSSIIACFFSHISLWKHCILIDKPIVILEHDAIMVKKIELFKNENSIIYLGNYNDYLLGVTKTPWAPKGLYNPVTNQFIFINSKMINGAHAYAISPKIAKKLIETLVCIEHADGHISNNFLKAKDYKKIKDMNKDVQKIFKRQYKYNIVYDDIYAYQLESNSTLDYIK